MDDSIKSKLKEILYNNKPRAINALIIREYPHLIEELKSASATYGEGLSYYAIIRHIFNEHICQSPECSLQTTLSKSYVPQSTCGSPECKSIVAATNRKTANMQKYGVENPFQSEEIRNKIKMTNLEKYGVENVTQNKEIASRVGKSGSLTKKLKRDSLPNPIIKCKLDGCDNLATKSKYGVQREYCSRSCAGKFTSVAGYEKRKKTCLEKYGTENPTASEQVKQKVAETNLNKFGVKNPFQSEEVKQRIKESNLEAYGSESAMHNPVIQDKIKKTNLKRHGVENVFDSQAFQDKARETKSKNYENFKEQYYMDNGVYSPAQKHYSDEAKEVVNDFDKLKELYKRMSALAMAESTGLSLSTVYRYLEIAGLREANGPSTFESSVGSILSNHGIFYKQSDRVTISPLELDFYLPDHDMAIECNGTYWHSDLRGKDRHYHLNKTKLCEEKGIRLIHIWEHDLIKNPDLIKCRLLSKLGLNERIFARKTQVAKLTTQTAAEFLNHHHLQGTCPASVKYGLYDKDELVAVMTLGKSRFSKNYEWELLRYCSIKQVIGGASKLFKHFQRECQPKSVVSYSDKMWNTGNLYKQLGFEHSHASKPSYYYTKNYLDFENRVAYQKHKLHKKLECFDPNLTEWENMQANGFDRIWDCGSDVWEFH